MSTYPPRQPPRFVPTLTQVVADEEQGAALPTTPTTPTAPTAPAPAAAPAIAASTVPTPEATTAPAPLTPPGAAPVRPSFTAFTATSTAMHQAPGLDAKALQQLEERLMAQIQTVVEEKITAMVQKHFPVLIGAMTREILRDIQPVVREALQPTRKP